MGRVQMNKHFRSRHGQQCIAEPARGQHALHHQRDTRFILGNKDKRVGCDGRFVLHGDCLIISPGIETYYCVVRQPLNFRPFA